MLEVGSHWISSYFLGDAMRLPATPKAALDETERQAAWLRHRYPQVAPVANGSHTSNIGFWGYVDFRLLCFCGVVLMALVDGRRLRTTCWRIWGLG